MRMCGPGSGGSWQVGCRPAARRGKHMGVAPTCALQAIPPPARHVDDADLVGLLCLKRAKQGGLR